MPSHTTCMPPGLTYVGSNSSLLVSPAAKYREIILAVSAHILKPGSSMIIHGTKCSTSGST